MSGGNQERELDGRTAKRAFEYTQGGKGEARISIMSGRPLAAYQTV